MDQPAATRFVNIVAWLFILLAGGAVILGLIQNLIIHFWPPLAGVINHYENTAGGSNGEFAWQAGILRNIEWVLAASLLSSLIMLTAAIGLLKRMNWARLLFVVMLGLGVLWLAASFVALLVGDPFGAGLADVPAEYQPAIASLRTQSRWVSGLFSLLLCLLLGWIIWRLCSKEVAVQFRRSDTRRMQDDQYQRREK